MWCLKSWSSKLQLSLVTSVLFLSGRAHNINMSAIPQQWQGHSLAQITHSASVWIKWIDVFGFQFVFVQKMLLTGGEGGEEIEESINQVQFCIEPATSNTEAFAGRLRSQGTSGLHCFLRPPHHRQPQWLELSAYMGMNRRVPKTKKNSRCIILL